MLFTSILFTFVAFANAFPQQQAQCFCGREGVSSRIIGGEKVYEGRYPWMALLNLVLPTGEPARCGGSLISDQYILTAAHCFPRGYRGVTVTLGINNVTEDRERLRVQYVEKHSMYNSKTTENDIALVKLDKPVTFTDKIRPICLPPPNMATDDTTLVIAGWGSTNRDASGVSQTLMETSVTEYPFDECNSKMGRRLNSKSQFCAAEIGKTSCSGDSGGPIMKKQQGKFHVVGLVSYRIGKCGESRASVRTRVTYFLDWVYRMTKDANYCQ